MIEDLDNRERDLVLTTRSEKKPAAKKKPAKKKAATTAADAERQAMIALVDQARQTRPSGADLHCYVCFGNGVRRLCDLVASRLDGGAMATVDILDQIRREARRLKPASQVAHCGCGRCFQNGVAAALRVFEVE